MAIQFKLAKVREKTYRNLQPNKLAELRKLYKQTNVLVGIGFNRVFACLVLLIDTRDAPGDEMLVGGLTEELRSALDRRVTLEGLHPSAGFIRVDLVQDPETAPLTTGEISGNILRSASAQRQPLNLTQWVRRRASAA